MPLPVMTASSEEEAKVKVTAAVEAVGRGERVNVVQWLRFAKHWKLKAEPIEEAFELAHKAWEAGPEFEAVEGKVFILPPTQPEEVKSESTLGVGEAALKRPEPSVGAGVLRVRRIDDGVPKAEPVRAEAKPKQVGEPEPPKDELAKAWPEAPLAPADCVEAERLTYPRGLLGHVVPYIVDTSALPDRWMALAGALCVLGKALDRKVIGPTAIAPFF